MGELQIAAEAAQFAGDHHQRPFEQDLLEEPRVEERRAQLGPMMPEGGDDEFARRFAAGPAGSDAGDGVDEGDVLPLLGDVAVVDDRGALNVLARVVPQQVVDGADAEVLIEFGRRLRADDEVQLIAQFRHRDPVTQLR